MDESEEAEKNHQANTDTLRLVATAQLKWIELILKAVAESWKTSESNPEKSNELHDV